MSQYLYMLLFLWEVVSFATEKYRWQEFKWPWKALSKHRSSARKLCSGRTCPERVSSCELAVLSFFPLAAIGQKAQNYLD